MGYKLQELLVIGFVSIKGVKGFIVFNANHHNDSYCRHQCRSILKSNLSRIKRDPSY